MELVHQEKLFNMAPLQHPFRMVLAAPSFAGKTTFVCNLLKQAKHTLSVPMHRIIWCYSQYQPLYDTLKHEIPQIEFVQGIPDSISEDYYLDPKINNLIVLDDLMTEVKNDTRIADMFSRGRHRNASVILLLQNVFPQGKAARDIALNSQYLVLFNNPVDRLQILTLARRIYPKNPKKLLNAYHSAISIPYGNLLVDLRATTPEHERLKINPLGHNICNIVSGEDGVLNMNSSKEHHSFSTEIMSENTENIQKLKSRLDKLETMYDRNTQIKTLHYGDSGTESKSPPTWVTEGISGQQQTGIMSLHRGIKRSISEETDSGEEDYEITYPRQIKLIPKEKLPDSVFTTFLRKSVAKKWIERINEKQDELIRDGCNANTARPKAINHFLPEIRKKLRKKYIEFILNLDKLADEPLHREIIKTIEHCKNVYGMAKEEAVNLAVKLRKHLIDENLLPEYDEGDNQDDNDSDDEDKQDEEGSDDEASDEN